MQKLIFLFLIFATRVFAYEYDLAICAIFRDEARFLKEWIEYHKLVGVQHFYLYNNLSNDNYLEILEPFVISGEVDLYEWPFEHEDIYVWNTIQCNAYTETITKQANTVKWLALIDIDEFIVPLECEDLITFLKEYEEFSGVGINWQMYGTSMICRLSEDLLMIEQLKQKSLIDNSFTHHIKCIVRPENVSACINPHFCYYHTGYHVDENKQPFCCAITESVNIDKIRINHYWSRDIEFLLDVKWPRHKSYANGTNFRDIWYIGNELFNQIYDNCMDKYIPKLKEKLAN